MTMITPESFSHLQPLSRESVAALGVKWKPSDKTIEAINKHLEMTFPMRLVVLRQGLRSEIRCPGLRFTRGPKMTTRCRREFGLSGKPEKLLFQLEVCMAAVGLIDASEVCGGNA
jgi:hypothetical protein